MARKVVIFGMYPFAKSWPLLWHGTCPWTFTCIKDGIVGLEIEPIISRGDRQSQRISFASNCWRMWAWANFSYFWWICWYSVIDLRSFKNSLSNFSRINQLFFKSYRNCCCTLWFGGIFHLRNHSFNYWLIFNVHNCQRYVLIYGVSGEKCIEYKWLIFFSLEYSVLSRCILHTWVCGRDNPNTIVSWPTEVMSNFQNAVRCGLNFRSTRLKSKTKK